MLYGSVKKFASRHGATFFGAWFYAAHFLFFYFKEKLKMKEAIKWILSAVVGSVVSFILVLISEGVHMLLTCAIVAGGISMILYYGFLRKIDIKLLISVVAFIIAFIAYLYLYNYVNEECDSTIIGLLVFFVPYILFSYIIFTGAAIDSQDNNNDQV